MSAQAAAVASQPGKKGKKAAVQLNFSELDDLFLNTKGKALRNLKKKMDKYKELDKVVRKGELKPNAQQKEQIASLPALKQESDDLEALCKLYMESNPNYMAKTQAISDADVENAISNSLALVGQVQSLTALMVEDASFVEISAAEHASLASVQESIINMQVGAQSGSKTFAKGAATKVFAQTFAKLSQGSDDLVKEGGVSYSDLNSFLSRCFSDNAQIVQRIADKELAAKRERQAAEEASRKQAAAEAKAAADAAKAEQDKAAADARYAADQAKAAAAAEKEESKDTSAATNDAPTAGEAQQANDQQVDGGDRGDTRQRGRGDHVYRGRGDGERRGRGDGERRGRGGDGVYRGRGDGERRGRGERGAYRGRGGYNKPREDDDGFITETGEKPKPRRGNFRGGRGRGDRGEFRGGRGDRGGDWDRTNRGGDRGRGGRPQTMDGGDSGAAAQVETAGNNNQGAQE